jgi:SAM-dependent methyltransferase
VVDLGCGAGTDLLFAAQMTGASGGVIGIDMTSSMLDRARASAHAMGLTNVELHESLIEELPLAAGSVDVVISNGVIDLVPDKGRGVRRDRPRPATRRPAAARRRLHPQRGLRRRPPAHRPLDRLNCRSSPGRRAREVAGRAGYRDIEQGEPVDTFARSKFDDTGRKAAKFGAMGSTIRATKPQR